MKALAKLNWREWELNPVVVKELRQAVRSWAVTGMLLLFTLVLFGTMVSVLVFSSVNLNAEQQGLGREVFAAFSAILTGTSLVFIPLYVGVRLAAERQEHNVDLLYITTLSPARIIRGKLLCGTYLTVLFFSVCLPFLVFTNLLRGVDLPTVFVALGTSFLASVLAVQTAIFLACLPATRGFKVLIAIPAVILGFTFTGTVSFSALGMMMSGVGSTLGTWDFWGPALTFILLAALIFGLLHVSSIALISPPSANRALPVRLYVTGAWAIFGIIAFSWYFSKSDTFPTHAWLSVTLGLMIVFLVIALCEGDERSVRVARMIPERRAKREIAFFFFSGTAGGLLWACALAVLTLVIFSALTWMFELPPSFPGPGRRAFSTSTWQEEKNLAAMWVTIFLYALSYCLAGLWVHRRWMPHRTPMARAMIAAILPTAWAVLPNLILFFANKLTWDTVQQRQLGNVFNIIGLRDDTLIYEHFYFATCFVFVMLLLNWRWFFAQPRAFKPYRREDAAKPPPLPN